LLALDNVFSTKSEEQEVNLVWPNLFLIFDCPSSVYTAHDHDRSEMRDLLIFIFILKTTGTFTPVHSAGYLILRNEFRSTQEIARKNIQELKYGLSLLKIHEKYKYIFRIIFYVSLIKNDKQKNEKKFTFLNHLLALDNVFSTKSEEQVTPERHKT
jgi:hypothetical protein